MARGGNRARKIEVKEIDPAAGVRQVSSVGGGRD